MSDFIDVNAVVIRNLKWDDDYATAGAVFRIVALVGALSTLNSVSSTASAPLRIKPVENHNFDKRKEAAGYLCLPLGTTCCCTPDRT